VVMAGEEVQLTARSVQLYRCAMPST
jgi:hypothetical protein